MRHFLELVFFSVIWIASLAAWGFITFWQPAWGIVIVVVSIAFAAISAKRRHAGQSYVPPENAEEALAFILDAIKASSWVKADHWRKFLQQQGIKSSMARSIAHDASDLTKRCEVPEWQSPSRNKALPTELARYVEKKSRQLSVLGFAHRTDRLTQAIEEVYRVFSTISKPERVEGCPCCFDEKDHSGMLHGDLRYIPEGALWGYNWNVFYTVGKLYDYKYFLPRILDLQARFDVTMLDPEMTFAKLVYADWLNWPTAEQAAVRNYLDAAFEAMITSPLQEDDFMGEESWLNGLCRCNIEVDKYLVLLDMPEAGVRKVEMLHEMHVLDEDTETWWYPDEEDPETFAPMLNKNREAVLMWARQQPSVEQPK